MTIHDPTTALELLSRLIDATVSPLVSIPELENLLEAHKQASIWEASTTYGFGAVVQPTAANRNGHAFRVVKFTSGVGSGATEPNWPTGRANEIVDGNLTWRENGSDFDCLWDLDAAAKAGWLLKAGKIATCTDVTIPDGSSFTFTGLYEHCIQQSEKYNSVTVS